MHWVCGTANLFLRKLNWRSNILDQTDISIDMREGTYWPWGSLDQADGIASLSTDLEKGRTNMARGMPSLAALLGLIAVAGYQNRDKIGDFVKGLGNSDPTNPSGGMLDNARKSPGDNPLASISGGLGELIERFRTNGQGAKADSWVADGPNNPINDNQVEQALGSDLIDGLVKQSGLSREELLSRLAKVLPDVVDKMTPTGNLPAQ